MNFIHIINLIYTNRLATPTETSAFKGRKCEGKLMWTYRNPVNTNFGCGQFSKLPEFIAGRRYALVTYPDAPVKELAGKLEAMAGPPVFAINDVSPNPDYELLQAQSARFSEAGEDIEVVVALGGGSVIDSAKVFAAAGDDWDRVAHFLETKVGADSLSFLPIIAVPTTAGTGSEVTCWATLWDETLNKKYSLAHPRLYPETALVDPTLMLGKPHGLTLATGLDSLSHSLESIWNVNANPISARLAVAASKLILAVLPELLRDLDNLDLRSAMAEASLLAGLAFSNTKTAIAHNISYPITLRWGVQHGIACSFTLPTVLRSVAGINGFRGSALREIFGNDLSVGADQLTRFLEDLGVGTRFGDHGVPPDKCTEIIDEAFAGDRGRNFVGSKESFMATVEKHNVIRLTAA